MITTIRTITYSVGWDPGTVLSSCGHLCHSSAHLGLVSRSQSANSQKEDHELGTQVRGSRRAQILAWTSPRWGKEGLKKPARQQPEHCGARLEAARAPEELRWEVR